MLDASHLVSERIYRGVPGKDTEITDPLDKDIAWYLMLYGRWGAGCPSRAEIVNGVVEYLEDEFMPLEDSGQGFEIVGWLSGMYSAFYHETTAPEGRIGQVRLDAVPGKLANLIPDDYHGKTPPVDLHPDTVSPAIAHRNGRAAYLRNSQAVMTGDEVTAPDRLVARARKANPPCRAAPRDCA